MKLREAVQKMNELNAIIEWLRVEMTNKYPHLRSEGIFTTVYSHYAYPVISIHGYENAVKEEIVEGGITFKVDKSLHDDPRVRMIISEILQMEADND